METKMKLLVKALVIIAFIYGSNCTLYAQSYKQIYQKGLIKEEGEGLLQEAIDLYNQIVENSEADRSLQANALLHIGSCYEKLGKKQASKAYEKILEKFADQRSIATIAKTRLQKLNNPSALPNLTTTYKPTSTQIPLEKIVFWNNYWLSQPFDFSPNGEKFVYMARTENPGENTRMGNVLFTADFSGTPVNFLIDQSEFYAEMNPKYSPDGNLIAFVGMRKIEDVEGDHYSKAIYIVSSNGGKPRQIGEILNENDDRGGLIWHPDSEHLSYLIPKGIVTIDLNGKITDTLSMYVHWSTKLSGFSPDGKWISYYSFNKGSEGNANIELDCSLVSLDGNKHIKLTQTKGFDGYGTWSEKDYSFYFVSDRKGDQNIFKLKIDPDTGEPIGDAEQVTFYYDASVFSPKFIKGKSILTYAIEKDISQIIIPDNKNFDQFKTIASGTSGILSPNGETVYYEGVGKNNQGIYSIPRLGGVKKRLTDIEPNSFYDTFDYLSPDGTIIAFFTKKNENKMELYFLSTKNGKLFKSINIESKGNMLPAWSPDSKMITYAHNGGLYTIPAWETKAEKLAEIRFWEPWSIRWSPDGKYIAGFAYIDNEDENHIMIVSTQNGAIKRLNAKDENKYKEGLEWHPGSKKLTYMYYDPKNDNDGLREAYVDGRPTTPFINQPEIWDYLGRWDPASMNYYFKGSYRGNWKLYRYNSASKKTTLFSDITNTLLPSWTKDGKFMVLSKKKREYQLWMMKGVE